MERLCDQKAGIETVGRHHIRREIYVWLQSSWLDRCHRGRGEADVHRLRLFAEEVLSAADMTVHLDSSHTGTATW